MQKPIVIIESPFAPRPNCETCFISDCPARRVACLKPEPDNICRQIHAARNRKYLRDAIHDSIARGEVPYASHAFFTQFLDDTIPAERTLGIELGFAMAQSSKLVAVYADLGITPGMQLGLQRHMGEGRLIEHRSLESWRGK